MATSTIAQREQLTSAVVRLRALGGFDTVASQVRTTRDRKVVLTEAVFNELLRRLSRTDEGYFNRP